MSSPSDSGHLPAPAPPPHHPLPPSAPGPGPGPATHGASPPKPKSPIATTAPSPPPEPNASAAAPHSSPAETTSAVAAASSRSSPAETTSTASARPEDHESPPSGDASGAASTSAIVAAAASARPEDCTPRMDMEFETELQAYDLYRLYAFKLGFNVRRRYTNRSKNTGEVTSCKFACSREGFKDQKPAAASASTAKLPRAAARLSRAAAAAIPAPDGRTGCNAHLTLRRTKPGGRFQVSGFQPRHNHPLFAAPSGLPSPFHLPPNAAAVVPPPDFIDDDATAGAAYAEGEGPLRTRRQWEIKYGEAAALLNYLQRQSLADPAFHHAVQLDIEDKVANVFWVDAKMVADYAHFGDAVAFDVVSRNSISLRHLASFVGCNSFGEPVVFGLALMYDETCESFLWLFQTFLRAMSGRAPKTFISHQDTVIAEALPLAMPGTTTHAICAWHIKHAAKGNIRQLSKGDANFIEEFKACGDGKYDEEAGFLAAWDAMLNKYELHENAWLQRLFEERQKWASPYVKGIFSAGMEGTRLNERLNSEVRSHLRAEVDIVLFLKHLQKVIAERRHRELEIEYGSRLMMPYLKIRAPVLTQASEVYTSVIFQLFQEEYEEFQSAYIVSRDESSPCREYVVSLVGKEDWRYTVYGNPTEQTVSCSCGKFETIGFLCSHALKILDVMDIKYIPERYIMKRWTKYARRLTPPEVLGQAVQAEESLEISNRYQYLCPKYVRLVARASECEESSRVLDQFWGELGEKVEQILQKQTSISAPVTQPDVQNLKMTLSSITNGTESENVLDISSRAAAKTVKKKGQKSKNHPRNCSEKGLTKKQRVHSEEPAVAQYGLVGGSAQFGNAMFQGLEAPPNMSEMGSQAPAYKVYMGSDFSNPMGTINYQEMHPGASLGFTLLPSQELGFIACHASQASSDSQHSQAL